MKNTQNQSIKTEIYQCPVCGHDMTFWLSMPIDCKTGKTIEYHRVYKCKECGYAEVKPRPDVLSVRSFYDLPQYYTQSGGHFADAGTTTILDKLRLNIAWRFDKGISIDGQWIHQFFGNKIVDICEIGCGSGNLLSDLSQMGYSVFGIEPNANSLAFKKDFDVYLGTAEDIPDEILSKQFDLIIINHVLEHCLNPLTALTNAYKMLRSGGVLLCQVPNNESKFLTSTGVTWEMLDIPRHLNFFNSSNLTKIVEKANFKVEEIFWSGYCREFSNAWINTEANIYERIIDNKAKPIPFPKKNSKQQAWKVLASTFLEKNEKKYDCVTILARK
ncbi:MAG: class I SAM-dependent methyltransferase [Crocosphaera sp.]